MDAEFFQRLGEEFLGCRLDSICAGTEVDRVHVVLEDPLFREAFLDLKSDEHLVDLASDADLISHEHVLDHLLGDGRTTTGHIGDQVVDRRREDCGEVDTGVLEELGVFSSEYGVHHDLGDVLVRDRLGVPSVMEFGEDLTRVGVDTADPAVVGKVEHHPRRVKHPVLLDIFEGPVRRVGSQEREQTDPT